MQEPNFFIVGAPKAGTTALYAYLSEHPRIFMPEIKEPHFFAEDYDHPYIRKTRTLADYRGLFVGATDDHVAVGEASVHYLHSDVALQNILEFNPQAKIIAMLRNPVELMRSLHAMSYSYSNESEPDFEKAWRLQAVRLQGRSIPPSYPVPILLQYNRTARLGTQVKRLLELFPEDQTHLILFDDFRANPKQIYENVLAFLEVPSDNRKSFPPVNVTRQYHIKSLGRFVEKPPELLRRIKRVFLGRRNYRPVLRSVLKTKDGKQAISPAFRAELVESVRDDVELLAKLLDRDLAHWLR